MKIKVTTAFNDRQNGCVTRPVARSMNAHLNAQTLILNCYFTEGRLTIYTNRP
ncbi:hypothetical protein ACTQ3M_08540 [Oscillospiraceae bacterium LCP25S3_E10]|nr:hypothetical protein [Ruminococcus sp.]MDD6446712.1 hypothetical protein [Ruminococcus sp.]MDY2856634.1 hypothetical protein [Oscillospiraceae bacterium]